jgi:hypothetical protein
MYCYQKLCQFLKPHRLGLYIFRNPVMQAPPHIINMFQDFFAYQEAKSDVLLAWFPKSHDNVVENLLNRDPLSYHEAKEHILNLFSNHHSRSGALSKHSKVQCKADPISLGIGRRTR